MYFKLWKWNVSVKKTLTPSRKDLEMTANLVYLQVASMGEAERVMALSSMLVQRYLENPELLRERFLGEREKLPDNVVSIGRNK
jgi:hypothetical protein